MSSTETKRSSIGVHVILLLCLVFVLPVSQAQLTCQVGYTCYEDSIRDVVWVKKNAGNIHSPTCEQVCKDALINNIYEHLCDDMQAVISDLSSFTDIAIGLNFACSLGGCWSGISPVEAPSLILVTSGNITNKNCWFPSPAFNQSINCQSVPGNANCFGERFSTICPCIVNTSNPSAQPTETPTKMPTNLPTYNPSYQPTKTLTIDPSNVPSENPSQMASNNPTMKLPTINPTQAPLNNPTETPLISNSTIGSGMDATTSPSLDQQIEESTTSQKILNTEQNVTEANLTAAEMIAIIVSVIVFVCIFVVFILVFYIKKLHGKLNKVKYKSNPGDMVQQTSDTCMSDSGMSDGVIGSTDIMNNVNNVELEMQRNIQTDGNIDMETITTTRMHSNTPHEGLIENICNSDNTLQKGENSESNDEDDAEDMYVTDNNAINTPQSKDGNTYVTTSGAGQTIQ